MPEEFSLSEMEHLKRRAGPGRPASGRHPAVGAQSPPPEAVRSAEQQALLPFTHVGRPGEGVDLRHYVRVVLQRWIWVFLSLVMTGGLASLYLWKWPKFFDAIVRPARSIQNAEKRPSKILRTFLSTDIHTIFFCIGYGNSSTI